MVDRRRDVQTYIAEFQANATKVVESGKRAARLYAQDDPAGAAMTIALTHYDIGYLHHGRERLLRLIEERHGVTPQDALGWADGEPPPDGTHGAA
jgi:hypothetical protein